MRESDQREDACKIRRLCAIMATSCHFYSQKSPAPEGNQEEEGYEERRKIATSISFTNIAVVGAVFASSILLLLLPLLL